MKIAQLSLAEHNLGRTDDLLRRYLPQPGRSDRRDFAWRYLWQASRPDEHQSFLQSSSAYCAVVSPDQRWLVTANFGARARVLDLATRRPVAEFSGIEFDAPWNASLAFDADGRQLVLGQGLRFSVIDVGSWRVAREMPCLGVALAAPRRGQTLVSAHGELTPDGGDVKDWSIRVWDVRDWSSFSLDTEVTGILNPSLAVSADGRIVAMASADVKVAEVWDTASRQRLRQISTASGIQSLALSPEGKWLAVAETKAPGVALWDVATGTLAAQVESPAGTVWSLAFSPDGRTLAGGSHHQMVLLWRFDAGGPGPVALQPLPGRQGHLSEVWSVAFTQDGQHLVTAGKDGTVRLWKLTPRRRPGSVIPRPDSAFAEFCLDRPSLWTLSDRREIEIWNLSQGTLEQRVVAPAEVLPHTLHRLRSFSLRDQ